MSQDPIQTIGLLDRSLSELKLLSKQELSEADKQTVIHHAEDCILLGRSILRRFGVEDPK